MKRQAVDKALVERILAAEGGTGIPACASAESQTRMSVAQGARDRRRSCGTGIDERLYRLYGLTPEEIKFADAASKG